MIISLSGFKIPIRDIRASVGAGFLYPLVGEVRAELREHDAETQQKLITEAI